MAARPQQSSRRSLRGLHSEPAHLDLSHVFDPQVLRSEHAALRGKIVEYCLVAVIVLGIAGYEWLRTVISMPQQPLVMTVFALLIVAYCAMRIGILWPQFRSVKGGQNLWRMMMVDFAALGEKGFYLYDGLRDADGTALAPVLVGPKGVFTLVIRTNPPTGRLGEKIEHLDNQTLHVGGRPAFADPLSQARVAAQRVASLLARAEVECDRVWPVLLYPGWKITGSPADRDVLVTSEKSFVQEVTSVPGALEPKQILALTEVLTAFRRG